MVALTSLILAIVAAGSASAANLHTRGGRGGGVTIKELSEHLNATGGTGQVSASGVLDPFGAVGVGCGINWNSNVSYGGGVQAGSDDYGLGGGFTIKPDALEIGLGIGYPASNSSASINFSAKDGYFELEFNASKQVVCTPGKGGSSIKCVTVEHP